MKQVAGTILSFEEIDAEQDRGAVVSLLANNVWPFHGANRLSQEQAAGVPLGPPGEVRAFWIVDNGDRIGIVRLLDLEDAEDGSVQFDLRLAQAHRGRGVGQRVVAWLTQFLFANYPSLHRIEAATRIDNHAMRKALESNMYQLEGRLRETWLSQDGVRFDTALYGRLRSDA